MSLPRLAALTLGPVVILATCYAVSRPAADPERSAFLARIDAAQSRSIELHQTAAADLARVCERRSRELAAKLPKGFSTLVRPPFVLAGDLDGERLDSLHKHNLQPVADALWRAYCDHRPDAPVAVVAVEAEDVYRRIARDLDGYDVSSYAAYYNREDRRIVMNLGTGSGTLAHELTHALVQFDFPDLPEWLDEGLASLHEETVFSADGLLLVPQPNWRERLVLEAVQRDRLPGLESLVRTHSFRGEGEGQNYAHVRCLCLYLYERQLLSAYYRKFRARAHLDPSGLETLRELLDLKDLALLDRDFSRWVLRRLGPKENSPE